VDDHRERKLVKNQLFCPNTPSVTETRSEWRVGLAQQFKSALKCIDKLFTKGWLLVFVPCSGFFKLSCGILAYFNLFHHLRILALAAVNTVLASNTDSLPTSIALILRHISMSHAFSIPWSAGPSKLATSSLANCALSASVSVITLARKLSNWAVVISGSTHGTLAQIMPQTATHNKYSQRTPKAAPLLLAL
jgi:hypothetical protein